MELAGIIIAAASLMFLAYGLYNSAQKNSDKPIR